MRSTLVGLAVASLSLLPAAVASAQPSRDATRLAAPTITSPVRLAATADGTVLVSDYREQRVFEMSPGDSRISRSFRVEGRPLALAFSQGLVYVGNETTRKIEVREPDGTLVRHFGPKDCEFGQPNDIAFDEGRRLAFVVDSGENVVQVFRRAFGTRELMIRTIPANGPDPSVLARPTALAVDPVRQEILVSDFGATELSIKPRVQVFDYSGNLVNSYSGKEGMTGYRFYRPQGLALVSGNRVFLADSYLGTVLVLDRATGSTLGTIGTYGTEPGKLALPLDVLVVAGTDDLLVANNWHGRVEVFPEGGAVR
jgi:DNA-binding beta-propeller fold protein YncE